MFFGEFDKGEIVGVGFEERIGGDFGVCEVAVVGKRVRTRSGELRMRARRLKRFRVYVADFYVWKRLVFLIADILVVLLY